MSQAHSIDLERALSRTPTEPLPDWRTILLATDGCSGCDDAVSLAREVAERSDAALHAILVNEPGPLIRDGSAPIFDALTESDHIERRSAMARGQLDRLLGGLDRHLSIQRGAAVEEILRYARAIGADLLVVGRGRHDLATRIRRQDHLLRLTRSAPCPVIAVGSGPDLPRRVVVGADLGPRSAPLVRAALRLAEDGATLYLVHVKPDPPFGLPHPGRWLESYDAGVRAGLERLVQECAVSPATHLETAVVHGHPGEAIMEFARLAEADLIAVGRRTGNFLDRLLVGRVGSRLVHSAPCSLLVVPGG